MDQYNNSPVSEPELIRLAVWWCVGVALSSVVVVVVGVMMLAYHK